VTAEDCSTDRRRRPPPSTPVGYLHELPALVLLDRLPTPTLAARLDGELVYANLAFGTMLGHPDATTLTGHALPALLAGHADSAPHECVAALRNAGAVTPWCHAEGFLIHTAISSPLLLRDSDPLLLISVIDITELLWTNPPKPR
jgi:hypothetical protein